MDETNNNIVPAETEQDASARSQSMQKPSRELKVEDALIYLDQVKMEFSDKPHIYNEFLEIMKNFKAQSINTPGVIERVKNLFKGYNKLILGFNTFLPEGEGYKIELTAEEQASYHPGQEVLGSSLPSLANNPTATNLNANSSQIPMVLTPKGTNLVHAGMVTNQLPRGGPLPQSSPMNAVGAPNTFGSFDGANPPGTGPYDPTNLANSSGLGSNLVGNGAAVGSNGSQQMQQVHAIHYVTKIRNRFSNQPETYRSFLKILHTYQKEQKGIKEVLEQVSNLFADHSDLLMEFTFFLPDAVQEQAKERLHRAARESDERNRKRNLGMPGMVATTLPMTNNASGGGGVMNPNVNASAKGPKLPSKFGANQMYGNMSGSNAMGVMGLSGGGDGLPLGYGRPPMDGSSNLNTATTKGKRSRAERDTAGMKPGVNVANVSMMGMGGVPGGVGNGSGTGLGGYGGPGSQLLPLHFQQMHQQQHLMQLQQHQQQPHPAHAMNLANLNGLDANEMGLPYMKKQNLGNPSAGAVTGNDTLGTGNRKNRRNKQQSVPSGYEGMIANNLMDLSSVNSNGFGNFLPNSVANITNQTLNNTYAAAIQHASTLPPHQQQSYLATVQQQLQLQQQQQFQQNQKPSGHGSVFGMGAMPGGGGYGGITGGGYPMNTGTYPSLQNRDSQLSMSAERRFFDVVKEVLCNGSSRENWTEFVKVLELFTGDAITLDEMLELVQDLFGSAHSELFEEFKRLLENRIDYEAHKHDVWYAVPLSEIDFTQCRKCTPSYRALPKDYPRAKCSERSEEEKAVLNDQWVSIPIGSEESYSFKHMRKNQYEEALFKVEDERFEVDMAIDSNMSTIMVFEPLEEEIHVFKLNEEKEKARVTSSRSKAALNNGDGMGHGRTAATSFQPRFSFQLGKGPLSTIHLNSISRIYGDHAEEILELLRRNPVGAIPILLKRLRQKDAEWRLAREELNKHWKEVVEKNHFKSFDHRSFYFRQQDKKYLSTKQLVQEILNHSHHHQQQQHHPTSHHPTNHQSISSGGQAAKDTVPIEPSTEIPTKDTKPVVTSTHRDGYALGDSTTPGVMSNVRQENRTLLSGMTPHLVLEYEHNAHSVHRDIYRILCHAAENTLTSVNDRERLAALWRDLFRVFFNIPTHYLYTGATPSFQTNPIIRPPPPITNSSNDSHPSTVAMDIIPSSSNEVTVPTSHHAVESHEAWPNGTKVLTLYGSGYVLRFRSSDGIYIIKLPYAVAYLSSSVIFGFEELSSQALYAIGVTVDEQGHETIYGGAVSTQTEVKATANPDGSTPLSEEMTIRDPCKLFYGTQMCYIFLRLHHILYTRLRIARELAKEALDQDQPPRLSKGGSSHGSDGSSAVPGEGEIDGWKRSNPQLSYHPYNYFLSQLLSFVEGTLDSTRYEEFCRQLLGNKSFVLYTLDKVVTQLIKHLQAMASDDNVNKLVGLFIYHHYNASPRTRQPLPSFITPTLDDPVDQVMDSEIGIVDPVLYQRHVAQILSHTMEDVFRIQLITKPSDLTDGCSEIAIQYLGILSPGMTTTLDGPVVTLLPGEDKSIIDHVHSMVVDTVQETGIESMLSPLKSPMRGSNDFGLLKSTSSDQFKSPSGLASMDMILEGSEEMKGSGVEVLKLQRSMSSDSSMLISGMKAPKVVISDDEEDEEEEENDTGDGVEDEEGATVDEEEVEEEVEEEEIVDGVMEVDDEVVGEPPNSEVVRSSSVGEDKSKSNLNRMRSQ